RRIRQVDDNLSADKRFRQSLTSDGVDAGIGRGGEGLVAALAQNGNGLRADQAGAPDDDDLHIRSPFGSRPQSDDCLGSLRIRITVRRIRVKSCQYLLSYNSSFLVCVSSAPSTIIRSKQ